MSLAKGQWEQGRDLLLLAHRPLSGRSSGCQCSSSFCDAWLGVQGLLRPGVGECGGGKGAALLEIGSPAWLGQCLAGGPPGGVLIGPGPEDLVGGPE